MNDRQTHQEVQAMLRSVSRYLSLLSVLAIAIGVVAIVWPTVTIAFVVALFAVAAFVSAARQASRAFSSATAGPVAGHLVLALVDVVAGVGSIVWPGITAYALTIWIGAWAIITGFGEFAMVFRSHETAGDRALFGFGGLLSVALGVVLFARPDVGALSLATVFGLFSLVYGGWGLVLATRVHQAESQMDKALHQHA
jgi:uncharacterized membrane protein HdeD (DUF308 family)